MATSRRGTPGGSLQSVSGGPPSTPLKVQTGANGIAQCNWTLDPTLLGQWQTVETHLLDAANNVLPQPIRFNAVNPLDAGIAITKITLGDGHDTVLNSDQAISFKDLANGIIFVLDKPLSLPDSAPLSPAICYLTVEVPVSNFVANANTSTFSIPAVVAGSAVFTTGQGQGQNQIKWKPNDGAIESLGNLLKSTTCLARFTIEGNFIWGGPAHTYLDGDTFGKATPDGAKAPDSQIAIALQLPSGDGRKGGDFRMWFWLTPPPDEQPAVTHPTITVDKPTLAFPTVSTAAHGTVLTLTVTLTAPPVVQPPTGAGAQSPSAEQPAAPPAEPAQTFNLAIVDDAHASFSLASPSSITLTPGQSAVVSVRFAPTSLDTQKATLQITNSTSGGDSTKVTLTGTGSAPA